MTPSPVDIYDFQPKAVEHCVDHLLNGTGGQLYNSPCGSGKTVCQVAVLKRIPDLIQLVPTPEIATQFAYRITGDEGVFELSDTKARELCESNRVYTYQRFYNCLSQGLIDPPKRLQYDESHHSASNRETVTYEYSGNPTRAGWTATPYRGTPKETKKLLEAWDNRKPYSVLTLKDAVARGVISHPEWKIWPLIDDETIDISNGEFSTKSVEKVVGKVVDDVVVKIRDLHCPNGVFDRPSTIALTSEHLCQQFHEACRHHGVPSTIVTSKIGDRKQAFKDVVACKTLLINIRVVGEGIDLPLRRMYDAAPTLSPVLWQQRLGRITRPTDKRPEYYSLCRNLTRHSYLWSGVLPASVVKECQMAFATPSKRDAIRGLGQLEGFGRFSPAVVPLADGINGYFYSLQSQNGFTKIGLFMHPLTATPIYGMRDDSQGTRGRWYRVAELPDVKGWVSTHNSPLTPGQQKFWTDAAGNVGLDHTATVNARSFQAMPFLLGVGLKVTVPKGEI